MMLRQIVFIPVVILDTIVHSFLSILVGIFKPYSRLNTIIIRNWARIILWTAGVKWEVEGLENIEPDQPYIITSNHQSHMDIPILVAALPVPLRIIAKKELFKIPIFGWGMKRAGMLSIDRSNRAAAMHTLQEAEKIIRREKLSILIFPEGTRSADGAIHPFKSGFIMLAINTHLPVLPVTLSGSRKILPRGKFLARSGKVKIHIHPPIPTDNLEMKDRKTLTARVEKIIRETFQSNF